MTTESAARSAVDPVTRKVLGIDAFLRRVSPHSELAVQRWQQLAHAEFESVDAVEAQLKRLRDLDQRLSPALLQRLGDDLCALPPLKRTLRRLDASQTLRDADFFEVKRFLYHSSALLEAADGLDDLPGADSSTVERFRDAMATLHPDHAGSTRFHLADELDEELADRRNELRRLRSDLRRRRNELETAIVDDLGGRFDIHGRYHPDDGPVDDDRLRIYDGYPVVDDRRLNALTQRVDELHEQVRDQEHRQRRRLTGVVKTLREDIERVRSQLAQFDLRASRTQLRRHIDGCWPQLCDHLPWMALESGRLPSLLRASGVDEVQPIDVALRRPGAVVLGPNMGGKSALLKLVGLASWCAAMAMPIPAQSCGAARMERIVYVGSEAAGSAEPTDGLSSFGREIRRFTRFWDAEGTTLWLLDEPCRGTHPEEGTRLAAAIINRLIERGDRVVVATHFPGLADRIDATRLRVAGLDADTEQLAMALEEARLEGRPLHEPLRAMMDYRVVEDPNGQVPRDGWRIARALGLEIPEDDVH